MRSLVGWLVACRISFVSLFVCFGGNPVGVLVGSVQNLRAGHFPLVTLVTLVRPIEGGVG